MIDIEDGGSGVTMILNYSINTTITLGVFIGEGGLGVTILLLSQ